MNASPPELPVGFMGETLSITERLIVAPSSGVFRRLNDRPRPVDGYAVSQGDMIGAVRSLGVSTPIRSPFTGFLIGVLAVEGQRMRPGQAVAWVRMAGHG